LTLLFTDLVGFWACALNAGDAAALELLRDVGPVVEAALHAKNALRGVEVGGYEPPDACRGALGPSAEEGRRLSIWAST
jgi:hypothetical protein